jgi:hypothetical protein
MAEAELHPDKPIYPSHGDPIRSAPPTGRDR